MPRDSQALPDLSASQSGPCCDTCGYSSAGVMLGFRCPFLKCSGRIVERAEVVTYVADWSEATEAECHACHEEADVLTFVVDADTSVDLCRPCALRMAGQEREG